MHPLCKRLGVSVSLPLERDHVQIRTSLREIVFRVHCVRISLSSDWHRHTPGQPKAPFSPHTSSDNAFSSLSPECISISFPCATSDPGRVFSSHRFLRAPPLTGCTMKLIVSKIDSEQGRPLPGHPMSARCRGHKVCGARSCVRWPLSPLSSPLPPQNGDSVRIARCSLGLWAFRFQVQPGLLGGAPPPTRAAQQQLHARPSLVLSLAWQPSAGSQKALQGFAQLPELSLTRNAEEGITLYLSICHWNRASP